MAIVTALWKVGTVPQELPKAGLASERQLEDMIVAAPRLISEEWMLIGRKEDTSHGGRIDLLALAPDASVVLIELKRDRTPRDVVAQTLDYASWVRGLRADEINAIYRRFAPGRDLGADFKQRFGQALDEDTLNESHQMVIVAASLDDSTERIVQYLNDCGIPINVLCFQVFRHGNEDFISRAWLLDPSSAPAPTAAVERAAGPWNGEVYGSFGEGKSRSWADAVKYGFFCAGGGAWYINTLNSLQPGNRIWVNVPGQGYVGVGRVTGRAQRASEFTVSTPEGEKPVLEVVHGGEYHRDLADDPTRCEHFVPVKWLQTVPVSAAISELGFFGNQNTVCRPVTPSWATTVERLKQHLPNHDAG